MAWSKNTQQQPVEVNVSTDMYVGQKLRSLKNLVLENKTIVSVLALSAIYYVVSQNM